MTTTTYNGLSDLPSATGNTGNIALVASNGIQYISDGTKWKSQGEYTAGSIDSLQLDELNFNGVLTSFILKVSGSNVFPENEKGVLIVINGSTLKPTTDFTFSVTSTSTTINFVDSGSPKAYPAGTKFYGLIFSRLPLESNNALQRSGGTMLGEITFSGSQDFPTSGIDTATTSRVGIVTLSSATESESETLAATSKSIKVTKTVADAALPKAGGTMTGDITFNSTQLFDGRDLSVDGLKLDGCDTGAKDDQTVDEIKTLIAGSPLDATHLAVDSVDTSEIKDNAVTTDKIKDAELTTLAGMQSGTASNLASGTALTATTTELNQLNGKTLETTLTTNSDTAIPTSKAVNDRIVAVANALGGFVAIADKDNFPTSHPDPSEDAGTVVSISNAAGISVNSSGVGSLATRAGGSDAVIINGFPTALRGGATVGSATNADPYILPSNVGLQVQTTSTAHTYDYHKYLINEEDANKLSGDIQDFQERYRVASSAPSSSLDDGDLWFDTTNNKMKVYNASGTSWDDVAAPGNFFINTISSSSGSGGGSAAFNGTATRFTLSSPPTQGAEQCIVSVNGVIQKPNSGTSPSEGFAVDGNDIIFAAAPATSSPFFIITIGNSVNIGTPSDNTVSTIKIQNLAVNGDKIAGDAVNGDKIADNSIDSEHYVDGSIDTAHIAADQITGDLIADDAVGAEHIEVLDANLQFADNAKAQFGTTDNDLEIYHDASNSRIDNSTGYLTLRSNQIALQNAAGDHDYLTCTVNEQGVRLHYDNDEKLRTASYGVRADHNLYVTENILIDNDTGRIKVGTGADLQIFHDGGASYVQHAGGGGLIIKTNGGVDEDITIQAKDAIFLKPNDGDAGVYVAGGGAVELYHAGNKKLETTADGIKLYDTDGTAIGEGFDGGFNFTSSVMVNELRLQDDEKIKVGLHDDLQIWHSGSNSHIQHDGTGNLFIDSLDGNITLRAGDGGSGTHNHIICTNNAGITLYHDSLVSYTTLTTGGAVQSNSTSVSTKYKTSEGTTRGHVYANASDNIGFLTNSGSWAFRLESDKDYMFYGNNISDRDRKDNITTVTGTSLDKITKLVPKTYNWKATDDGKTSTDRTFTGFIAQEVKEHLPSLVNGTDGQKNMSVDYNGILAHAVKAITELSAEVETLKTKVAALEAK